jgi:uncharacterized protein (DUF58 family)
LKRVNAGQLTTLLTNRDLDRLARLRLNAVRRLTNRSRGEHLAAKGGTSTEFCDYRDYAPGDDTRFVDWNIFARINRPYLKQFHMEEEMHVVLAVDASASMMFEGKLALAQQLAAAFGVIGLRSSEKVSAWRLRGIGGAERLAPTTGRAGQRKLFAFLEGITGGGDATLDAGIENMLRHHRGRGVVVLLSDFLTTGDLRRSFNFLASAGLEVFALQILGPTEISPDLSGDLRLVDSETDASLDITSAGDLLALYHEYRENHSQSIAQLSSQRHGRFVTTSAAEPFEALFFDTLRRKGWIV